MPSSTSPARLYLMELGRTTVPTSAGPLAMSVGCYLIQTADGKNILIDSGLPSGHEPPTPGEVSGSGSDVLAHLAALDLGPDNVDLLVCSHFDIDHVGQHDAFGRAELVVQRAHYELARSGHPRFAAGRAHWDHPALRYRLVDGDTQLLPGLTLLASGGHAPGHQSVLVKLPRTGAVLLAIDAVVMEHLFHAERRAWPTDDDEDQLRASTRRLLDLVEREPVAFTVFGHDGAQWQRLRKAPDFYD
ncbi:MAG TPA: N-acyl homoserine lactonase family protein [Thermomicrobiaceae bacterium]|nr:N-acyl homoserine lactonase family protein [Thermomicrobiaceae bacterium]